MPGNRGLWRTAKWLNRQEFVIVGWSDPEGTRPYLGALLLGYYTDVGKLIYAGRVATRMLCGGASGREPRSRRSSAAQKKPRASYGPRRRRKEARSGWGARFKRACSSNRAGAALFRHIRNKGAPQSSAGTLVAHYPSKPRPAEVG
jgi:hypothetical protein